MKKSIVLLAACLLFTACGASEESQPVGTTANDTISAAEENTTATESEEPAVNENPDFRNVSWGMSVDDVKKYEDATLSEENKDENAFFNLRYSNISVMGHPADLGYSFSNGKLSSATYQIPVTESKDYMINNTFFEIADAISLKYGNPEKETLLIYCGKDFYSNRVNFLEIDNFSFDTSEYCKANDFEIAAPLYSITWKTSNTEIWLDMYIPRNDDGIFIAPDTYSIRYSAIDVDNAL